MCWLALCFNEMSLKLSTSCFVFQRAPRPAHTYQVIFSSPPSTSWRNAHLIRFPLPCSLWKIPRLSACKLCLGGLLCYSYHRNYVPPRYFELHCIHPWSFRLFYCPYNFKAWQDSAGGSGNTEKPSLRSILLLPKQWKKFCAFLRSYEL